MTDARVVTRRRFVRLVAGTAALASLPGPLALAAAAAAAKAGKLAATPPNPLGPFYKSGAPVRQKLVESRDNGLPVIVRGRITDLDGAALTAARIEVFHADPNGEYDRSGYRYRARIPVRSNGEYEFETLMPGHYVDAGVNPDQPRPEHIHYRIEIPGRSPFATQLYFVTDPFFESDPERTLRKDPLVRHRELIRPVELFVDKGQRHAAVAFDLRLET